MNTFFLPLRREYETKLDEYQALWPLKQEKMVEGELEIIYSYEQVISEKKI